MSPRLFLLHCDEGNVVVILFPLRRGFTLVVAGENDLSVALTISVHFLILIVARASISTLDLSKETKNVINFLSHQAHHFFSKSQFTYFDEIVLVAEAVGEPVPSLRHDGDQINKLDLANAPKYGQLGQEQPQEQTRFGRPSPRKWLFTLRQNL